MKYVATGYDKATGAKKTMVVEATSSKHARTIACETLLYPIVGRY